MISTKHNRVDPSLVAPAELDQLFDALSKSNSAALISPEGESTHIPAAIYQHLANLVRMMREGRAIVMMPEDETFTTQAAANFLGMSRQFFVNMLEDGQIPHHRVGAHRRVYFKDLLEYQVLRDRERNQHLNKLSKEVEAAGLYESDYTGEE